jgi:hypothetical protein
VLEGSLPGAVVVIVRVCGGGGFRGFLRRVFCLLFSLDFFKSSVGTWGLLVNLLRFFGDVGCWVSILSSFEGVRLLV